jgi:hypothetical protein
MSSAGPPLLADIPVAVVGGLLVALVVLALQRPPVTRRTALALAPWAVAGALVHAVGVFGGYPSAFLAYTNPIAVAGGTVCLAVLAWAPLVQLRALRGHDGDPARYLAASGTGVAVVLFVVVLLRGLPLSASEVLWLTIAPVLAALLAGVSYFLLGLRVIDALAYTRFAGLFAVFGQAFDGVALAVCTDVFGVDVTRPVLTPLLDAVATAPVPTAVTLVALKLLFGLAVVVAVVRGARDDRWWAFVCLAVVGGVGLGSAVATLLVAGGG